MGNTPNFVQSKAQDTFSELEKKSNTFESKDSLI